MVVSLLAVTNRAKRALPEMDPTPPAKLIPLRSAANNLSCCEGYFRALDVLRPSVLFREKRPGTTQNKGLCQPPSLPAAHHLVIARSCTLWRSWRPTAGLRVGSRLDLSVGYADSAMNGQ